MDPDDSELDLTLEDLEQVLREIIRLDPKNVATMIRLGEFFLERDGAEDVALESFEQTLALQPGNKKLAKARAQQEENQD
jgi:cytochrome c-type biogenesis protein CcmH/NrfG